MHRTLIVDAGKEANEAGCAAVWGVVDAGVSGHVYWVLCEAAAAAAASDSRGGGGGGRVQDGADVRDLVTGRRPCCCNGSSSAGPAVQQAEAALKPQSANGDGHGGGGGNRSEECEVYAAAAAPRSSTAVELVARGVVAVDPFANGGCGKSRCRRGTAAATPFTFTVRGVAPGTAYTLYATLSRASAGVGRPRSRHQQHRHRPAGDDDGVGVGVGGGFLALVTAGFRTESSGA
eukprot:Rhum_TRINITY_DN7427_c0_g1::Rhum_TRINITY_DN7427_c0_g1_i1::g.22966::m.22966